MNILYTFMLFITYSFLGYLMEVIYCSFFEKKLVNRGFLIGPYCPIYGCGYLLISLILSPYKDNPMLLFITALIVTSSLEYITSYLMEKLFHTKWWDYSHHKININGRVCLLNSFLFGIASLVMVYLIDPIIINFYEGINSKLINSIAIPLLIIFMIDFITSCFIARGVIKRIDLINLVEEQNRANIKKFKSLNKRVLEAFPNLKKINTNLKDYIYQKNK